MATDLDKLNEMLETPLDGVATSEVQDMIAYRFGKCVEDLAECATQEQRKHVLGRAFKGMFVLGRWSILMAWRLLPAGLLASTMDLFWWF
jgi:hypothetical protein